MYQLSDHANTIVFYGNGVIVRLHQAGRIIHISAVSGFGPRVIRIKLKRA